MCERIGEDDARPLWSWAMRVETEINNILDSKDELPDANPTHTVSAADLACLGNFHRNFVVTTVDKASNNYVMVCKKHYLTTCLAELQKQNGAYGATRTKRETLIKSEHDFCKREGVKPQTDAAVPNFHTRVKLHKYPHGYRYVAGSAAAPTRPVSDWLTLVFNVLMVEANDLWREITKGIREPNSSQGSWMITNTMPVRTLTDRVNRSGGIRKGKAHLATYDFTTMYTTISLKDLIKRVSALVDELFERKKRTKRTGYLVVWSDGRYKWTNRLSTENKNSQTFSADRVKRFLIRLVTNTHVEFAGKVWKQKIGLPMGTPCAGQLANLYCFTYELRFMRAMIKAKQYPLAKRFLNVQRYIDDLLVINIPEFEQYMYIPDNGGQYRSNRSNSSALGIYPRQILTLERADSGTRVPYMDALIRQNSKRGLIVSIYDKRLDAKYAAINVIRYPDYRSVLARKCKTGIVTSQLHRFARLCTLTPDIAFNAALVLHRMLQKGYPEPTLWQKVRSFLVAQTRPLNGIPVSEWIRRMKRQLGELGEGLIRPGPHGPIRVRKHTRF